MPSNDKPLLIIPKNVIENEDQPEENDDDDLIDDLEKHLDLPPSWVSSIIITPKGKRK